ncbi:hypothetical protein [Streptomyces sp. NBC_01237]|uniref:hypothetical protein n=1 Tax=Streptomyces sp. NBC_01237 TaxID=2903790 RepID=UPI002DDA0565|nr:hypothetical protein [Streptomyces sp. NBC_01237]WRZ78445.1 hypothetical protein OG251_36805 [Streptomyces sp. NBC_01237]
MNSTTLIPGKDGLLAGNDDLMNAHRAIRAAQGRMDNLCGASSVYAQACDHHRQVINWLHRTTSSADRACIAALAADTGGFVGFLTYDQGMTEMAAGYYLTAADHAQAAGDLSVAANLLGQYSRVAADRAASPKPSRSPTVPSMSQGLSPTPPSDPGSTRCAPTITQH